jgi:dipeptide/tripeptide permease
LSDARLTWRYPRTFWIANAIELFERAAWYGTFIALRTYLLRVVGLDDVQAGYLAAFVSAFIYLFPFLTGAAADRIGFRASLLIAFVLLTAGYAALGAFHALGPVLVGLLLIVIGGAFVKPVIAGTAARYSDTANRARAFSLFYMVVNIGSFTGKTIAAPVRIGMGVDKVPWFSAAGAGIALLIVLLFYRPKASAGERSRSVRETFAGMAVALGNLRFLALILITAGFWAIQGQLYASMPDYVIRMAGETYKPEWYANVDPLIVVLCVVWITHMVRAWPPARSIAVAMALIPLSSLIMAMSAWIHHPVLLFGAPIHPITLMMVIGIALQGLAECFLSPRYLEFASLQAPPGREGLYLGYAQMNTFFAWLFGFIFAGYMLKAFCPDPKSLPADVQAQHTAWLAGHAAIPAAYAHAHYLWYAFTLVGAASFVMMLVYAAWTGRADARRREASAAA